MTLEPLGYPCFLKIPCRLQNLMVRLILGSLVVPVDLAGLCPLVDLGFRSVLLVP